MKKQNGWSSSKAQFVRGAFYLLLLIFVIVIPFALAQQRVIKPAGVPDAHLVSSRPPVSPQVVIYDRSNNAETKIPLSPGPTGTSTATATATATITPTPCNQYWITSGSLPIVPGTTDTGNHCDDCDTAVALPFPFRLYGVTFNSVMISSNGRLDFVCNNEPELYTFCLPAEPHNCPYSYSIFPLWTNLQTDINGYGCPTWANGCGIFTSVSGSAPNRIFNIEWHAVLGANENTIEDFEVRLYENDPNQRFDVIYGAVYPLGFTFWVSGVQGPPGFFTQENCQGGMFPPPMNVSRTYTFVPCASPTATPRETPTPRGHPSPPPRLTS